MEHCSLTGGATNPISNWTQIISTDSGILVPEIIKRGQLPPIALPTFMHEVMHHWCFHSPVGLVLAMSNMRSRRAALAASEAADSEDVEDLKWECSYDSLRFRAANTLLRPLSEGLALFAEFDAIPGDSEVVSTVCKSVLLWFGDPERKEASLKQGRFPAEISNIIFSVRMSETIQKRKLNLLSQSLRYDPSSDDLGISGGYLLGYLLIKNIHHALIQRGCYDLLDKDLFLSFVRSYMFEDYGLAAQLMASARGEQAYAEDLGQYVRERLRSLVQDVSPDDVAAFEKHGLSKTDLARSTAPPSHFRTDPQAWTEGQRHLASMLEALQREGTPDATDAQRALDLWTMARRHMICVASSWDHVRVKNGRVSAGRHPDLPGVFTLNAPALPGVAEQEGEGEIQCFIVPDRNLRIMSVNLDGKAVAVMFIGKTDPEFERDFREYELDAAKNEGHASVLDAMVQAVIADLGVDEFHDSLIEGLGEGAERLYLDYALMLVPDEKLESTRRLLAKNGLYTLLGNDFQSLEAVSIASLLGTMANGEELLADVLRKHGHKAQDMLKACAKAEKATGFVTISQRGGLTLSAV